jgi:hypothetical protein
MYNVLQVSEMKKNQKFFFCAFSQYPGLPDGLENDTHLALLPTIKVCDLVIEEFRDQVP